MSPKQRKKAYREKKPSSSDSSTISSPVTTVTNYREIHLNEVEALRSIYGDDFEEVVNRRSAWQVSVLQSLLCVYCASVITHNRLPAILRCDIQAQPAGFLQF